MVGQYSDKNSKSRNVVCLRRCSSAGCSGALGTASYSVGVRLGLTAAEHCCLQLVVGLLSSVQVDLDSAFAACLDDAAAACAHSLPGHDVGLSTEVQGQCAVLLDALAAAVDGALVQAHVLHRQDTQTHSIVTWNAWGNTGHSFKPSWRSSLASHTCVGSLSWTRPCDMRWQVWSRWPPQAVPAGHPG